MHITLTEKTHYKYIYVDRNNKVHISVPLASVGNDIALDNTCRSTIEIKTFFNIGSEKDESQTVIHVLQTYIKDLSNDITLLIKYNAVQSEECQKKIERKAQLEKHLQLLSQLHTHKVCEPLLKKDAYPDALNTALQDKNTNCVGIRLSPKVPDSLLRVINPLFSMERSKVPGSMETNPEYASSFAPKLTKSLTTFYEKSKKFGKVASAKDNLWQAIKNLYLQKQSLKSEKDHTVDLTILKECIKECLKKVGYTEADALTFKDDEGNEIDLNYVENICGDTTLNDCIITLVPKLIKEDFLPKLDKSPFDNIGIIEDGLLADGIEKFSIRVQFFLGLANILYFEKSNNAVNFAKFIENNQTKLIKRIQEAIDNGSNIEDTLIQFLEPFGKLDPTILKNRFRTQFYTILNAPHFDEFLILLSEKPGMFFGHQNRMALHLSEFCRHENASLYKQYFEGDNALATTIALEKNDPQVILKGTNDHIVKPAVIEIADNDFLELAPDVVANLLITIQKSNNEPAFINMDKKVIDNIKNRGDWDLIKTTVYGLLQDTKRRQFEKRFNLLPTIHITKEMEQALVTYYGLIHSQTDLSAKHTREEKFLALFNALNIQGSFSLSPHEDGGVVICFSNTKEHELNKIKLEKIVKYGQKIVHINRAMIDNFRFLAKEKSQTNSGKSTEPDIKTTAYTHDNTEFVQILKILFPHLTILTEEQKKECTLTAGNSYIPAPNEVFVGHNHTNGFVIRATPDVLKEIRDLHMNNSVISLTSDDVTKLLIKAKHEVPTEMTLSAVKSALDACNINYHFVQMTHEGFIISCDALYRRKLKEILPKIPDLSYKESPYIKHSDGVFINNQPLDRAIFPIPLSKDVDTLEKKLQKEGDWLIRESASAPGLITMTKIIGENPRAATSRRFLLTLDGWQFVDPKETNRSPGIPLENNTGIFFQESLIKMLEKVYHVDPQKQIKPEKQALNQRMEMYTPFCEAQVKLVIDSESEKPKPPEKTKTDQTPVVIYTDPNKQKLIELKQITEDEDASVLIKFLKDNINYAQRLKQPIIENYLKYKGPILNNIDDQLFTLPDNLVKFYPLIQEGIFTLESITILQAENKAAFDMIEQFINLYSRNNYNYADYLDGIRNLKTFSKSDMFKCIKEKVFAPLQDENKRLLRENNQSDKVTIINKKINEIQNELVSFGKEKIVNNNDIVKLVSKKLQELIDNKKLDLPNDPIKMTLKKILGGFLAAAGLFIPLLSKSFKYKFFYCETIENIDTIKENFQKPRG